MKRHALEGIKVLEFTWFAAGPRIAEDLAMHGAEVIHVESASRPDGFRTYPPFKDNKPGINNSFQFAINNGNKYGITLNLRHPQGHEIAKRLVAWADVVTENMTPGAMARQGLNYEELVKVKPDIIMLSSCNQGQTGPHASHPGFGSHLTNLSGFTHITGWPDRGPMPIYGPYIDFIGVAFGTVALLAALDYRRRTGKGQYIDISQYETGLQFLIPSLLDYCVSGRTATREGNHCHYAAPHGAYPCRGEDSWCVISVFTSDQWSSLCQVIGNPEWCQNPKFATLWGRKQNEEELDRLVGEWTCKFTSEEVMKRLQAAGVSAAMVQTSGDILDDPHLKHYVWRQLEHPVMGRYTHDGSPFLLSKTPYELRTSSPGLGEHNEYVYTKILGMSQEEYARLSADGVFD